ncbi:MAG TPA: hypothetical protein DD390_13325 [Rhodospirillaceae bacterium]|nr:hypothetical protein [Rhodospirillaceae bacterium]
MRLDETGADGLVPVNSLPYDRYWHDEVSQRLIGQHDGLAFQLAEAVTVKLTEANTITGGLAFEIVDGGHIIKDRKERTPGHGQGARGGAGPHKGRRTPPGKGRPKGLKKKGGSKRKAKCPGGSGK